MFIAVHGDQTEEMMMTMTTMMMLDIFTCNALQPGKRRGDHDNNNDDDNDSDNHDDNYEDLYLQCMVAREEKRLLLLLLAAVQAESITVTLMIIVLIKSYLHVVKYLSLSWWHCDCLMDCYFVIIMIMPIII